MFLDYFTYYLYVMVTFFVIYLFIFKNDFSVKHKREIFYLILGILFYTQYRRYGARLFAGTFEYHIENLPIHFCRMSALMTLLYLLTKNKIVRGFVFFQSGLGFLSVVIPGGLFFILPYDWRAVTYLFDHFTLAIMPVFLVFIMDYVPNKRDFRISLVYSIVVPLLVLPIAIHYDYNAYYVLDGVFIKDVVGDNQFLITSIMMVLLIVYNYLMWYLGKYLVALKEKRKGIKTSLFKPLYPWVIVGGYLVIGLLISFFYFGKTPTYLKEIPDAYISRPYKSIEEKLVIYQAVKDGELYYFIEVRNDQDIVISSFDNQVIQQTYDRENNVVYFSADNLDDQIMIQLISNRGEENESYNVYVLNIENDYVQFLEDKGNKLITN